MSATMGHEVKQPKLEVLKLPYQDEWRNLLEYYGEILNDEINETEGTRLLREEEAELPPFIKERFSSITKTEDEYALQIINDLFRRKDLNSYACTLIMINHHSNTVDDIVNHKRAWIRISKYLIDYDTLLKDTNEMGAKYDYIPWEKPVDFMWINPDLQPKLLPEL